ncbi:EF-hand domain-containing protein [Thalassovita taeanensis]|uniref:EF-hand domain pair n=1 Tax=Thalassovita taeanensis TaxID=657014 RepID=A0A1H9EPJ7_9RHOB|nr:EF-hand domain-containing protein [Thalassovita taeanensis]SEQ27532.1 EF-hand domain pair [Thalassovita taeanensis]
MKRAILITGLATLALAGTTLTASAFGKERMHGHGGPRITFEEVDTNADGKVTPEEMQGHFKARFDEADTDKDGALSADEMTAQAQKRAAERMAKNTARMIKYRDENGDGKLSLEEMQPKRMGKMFSWMDANDDGAISAKEFSEMQEHRGRHDGKKGRFMPYDDDDDMERDQD